ncbi:MAG: hypothetical protein JWQ11_467 [Rhizobacter sp.]|nr:hypothetical protein [Rhizobacter sp.]
MSTKVRDRIKSASYFQAAIDAELSSITRYQALSAGADLPAATRSLYKLAAKQVRLTLHRYSRGDPVGSLREHFTPMLDAWEQAELAAADLWSPEQQRERHDWRVNFDFYVISFWLVGLALAFEVGEGNWRRLLSLIGNDGNDRLLDRVIASRSPERTVGATLRHVHPYGRLLACIEAPVDDRPALLKLFVDRWYVELGRRETTVVEARELVQGGPFESRFQTGDASTDAPYWHGHHTLDGGYFGYWCLEAVAVVKAFGIDDTPCLGHRHYPGDLLRGEAPEPADTAGPAGNTLPRERPRRLARWFGRR